MKRCLIPSCSRVQIYRVGGAEEVGHRRDLRAKNRQNTQKHEKTAKNTGILGCQNWKRCLVSICREVWSYRFRGVEEVGHRRDLRAKGKTHKNTKKQQKNTGILGCQNWKRCLVSICREVWSYRFRGVEEVGHRRDLRAKGKTHKNTKKQQKNTGILGCQNWKRCLVSICREVWSYRFRGVEEVGHRRALRAELPKSRHFSVHDVDAKFGFLDG